MIEDVQSRSGNTLTIDGNFCRAIPIHEHVLIEAQLTGTQDDFVFFNVTIVFTNDTSRMTTYGHVIRTLDSSKTLPKLLNRLKTTPTLKGSPYTQIRSQNNIPQFSPDLYLLFPGLNPEELAEDQKMRFSVLQWWVMHWSMSNVDDHFSASLATKNMKPISVGIPFIHNHIFCMIFTV